MSILIKGMEMPESCMDCPFKGFDRACGRGNICTINESITFHAVLDGLDVKFVRMGDCPLIPVPPHGRLIDADDFISHYRKSYCGNCGRRKGTKNGKEKFIYKIGDAPCRACDIDDMIDAVECFTTVIEAEESE